MQIRNILTIIIFSFSCSTVGYTQQPSDKQRWNLAYEYKLREDKNSALNMLQARYSSLPPGVEKLYVSSLIYHFMNQHNQPYFGRTIANQSKYSKLEQSYIHALNDENKGDYTKAIKHYLPLLNGMQVQNNIDGKILFEYHLCKVLNHQGQYYEANYYCSSLNTHIRDSVEPLIPFHKALRVIANNQFFRGEYNNALETYLKLIDVLPNKSDISAVYNDTGNLLKVMGSLDLSESYLLQSLAIRQHSSNPNKIAQVQHSLGELYLVKQQYDLSINYFNSALKLLKPQQNNYGLGLTYIGLGDAYIAKDEHQLGNAYLVQGLNFAEKLENKNIKAKIYLALAQSYYARMLYIPASNYAKEAQNISISIHHSQYQSQALLLLAKIAEATNSYKIAYKYYKEYSQIELAKRDINNNKALAALDLSKAKFEQDYKRSELFNQSRYQAFQIKTMEQQKVAYNFILAILITIVIFFIYLNRKTKLNAQIDSLTGILNRAASISMIKSQPKYCNPEHRSVLILLDLDNFKSVNDNYGHPTGDLALKHVAKVINSKLESNDVFGRLGGEEFIILLTDVDILDVRYRVESIHKAISMKSFSSESNQPIHITASFSYLATSKALYDFDDLYSILDQALYQAKLNGRDCIIDAYNDPIDLPSVVYSSTHP